MWRPSCLVLLASLLSVACGHRDDAVAEDGGASSSASSSDTGDTGSTENACGPADASMQFESCLMCSNFHCCEEQMKCIAKDERCICTVECAKNGGDWESCLLDCGWMQVSAFPYQLDDFMSCNYGCTSCRP